MDFDIDKVKEEYVSGDSTVALSKRYGVPASTIASRLAKVGVKLRSNKQNSRRFEVNHGYFTDIDTEEKAYWLGFMFADGYVTSTAGKRVGCTLSSRDKDHLEKFAKSIDATYSVKTYTGVTTYGPVEYSRLLVASDQMYDDLVRHGCVERKSNVLVPPTTVPESLEFAFIRGYIDGDGAIAIHKGAKSGFRIKIIGTLEIIEWIAARFEGGAPYKDKRHDYAWQVDVPFNEYAWEKLYEKSSISLDRKFARALHGHRRLSKVDCDCSEFCSS